MSEIPKGYHRHSNGGGLVADTAYVEDTVYVGPNARVSDSVTARDNAVITGHSSVSRYARVIGNAEIRGYAEVGDYAFVGEDAQVEGHSQIGDSARVFGHALVCGHARVYGSARVCGYTTLGEFVDVSGDVCILIGELSTGEIEKITKINLQIVGSRAPFVAFNDKIVIGCQCHKIEYWLDNYRKIGENNGYPNEDIAEYYRYICFARDLYDQK